MFQRPSRPARRLLTARGHVFALGLTVAAVALAVLFG